MELENKTLRDYLQSISVLSVVQAGEYDSLDDKYRFELSELRINANSVRIYIWQINCPLLIYI